MKFTATAIASLLATASHVYGAGIDGAKTESSNALAPTIQIKSYFTYVSYLQNQTCGDPVAGLALKASNETVPKLDGPVNPDPFFEKACKEAKVQFTLRAFDAPITNGIDKLLPNQKYVVFQSSATVFPNATAVTDCSSDMNRIHVLPVGTGQCIPMGDSGFKVSENGSGFDVNVYNDYECSRQFASNSYPMVNGTYQFGECRSNPTKTGSTKLVKVFTSDANGSKDVLSFM